MVSESILSYVAQNENYPQFSCHWICDAQQECHHYLRMPEGMKLCCDIPKGKG